ncbi:hypothetical protein SC206_19055 [Rouxiella sp. T17]|uniref:hypothetical protein n=1 Tax=Rouxiella sp. T17 TaxID=3085684 RepID=UPI002FCBC126
MKRYEIKQLLTQLLTGNNLVLTNPYRSSVNNADYTLFIGDMTEQYTAVPMGGSKVQTQLQIDFVVVGNDEEKNDSVITQVLELIIDKTSLVALLDIGVNASSIEPVSSESQIDSQSTDIVNSTRLTIQVNYTTTTANSSSKSTMKVLSLSTGTPDTPDTPETDKE